MKHGLVAACLVVSMAAALAADQAPSSTPKAEPRSGSVRGTITAAETGAPLRRARVTLQPVLAPLGPAALTANANSQGAFEVTEVPEGAYFVRATAAGYLSIEHGQRRPGERGMAVEVRAGRVVERINIALPKGAVLAGRITDELGEPYPGVQVLALQSAYRQGRRVPIPAGTVGMTDDRGQYRISGLPPGAYYVFAASPETWRNEKKETFGYAATSFPGVPVDRAEAVTVTVSQERRDLDFTMTMSRTARVRGRLLGESGAPLGNEPITLMVTVRGLEGALGTPLTTRSAADGSFEISQVPPGSYRLLAGRTETASALVEINGDVDNLLLTGRSGSTVTGAIVTDDGTAPPFSASGVRLNLIAADEERVLRTTRLPAVNNDWSFRLTNLGGPFVFRVNGLPPGWALAGVKLGEQDLTDTPWDVPTGNKEIAGLQIVLTRNAGTMTGKVVRANDTPTGDATIVVFPDDEKLWMAGSRHLRTLRPAADGTFTIAGLPEAIYLAVALEFVEDGQSENREFLDGIRQDATRVVITPGRSETLTLRLR